MRKGVEYLPALPFVNWANLALIALEAEVEPGLDNQGPVTMFAADLGIHARSLYRYLHSLDGGGKPTENFRRDNVEDMLHRVGIGPWQLGGYADLVEDPEVHEGFCSRCDETVLTSADHLCLWCDTMTTKPMSVAERRARTSNICSRCDGPKQRGAVLCKSCRDEVGQPGRGPNDPTSRTCPDCGGRKSWRATICRECWRAKDCNRGKRSRRAPTLITENQLQEARGLYFTQRLAMRAVAAIIYPDSGYVSEEACVASLRSMFRARGWKLRSKSEAMKLAAARRSAVAA